MLQNALSHYLHGTESAISLRHLHICQVFSGRAEPFVFDLLCDFSLVEDPWSSVLKEGQAFYKPQGLSILYPFTHAETSYHLSYLTC